MEISALLERGPALAFSAQGPNDARIALSQDILAVDTDERRDVTYFVDDAQRSVHRIPNRIVILLRCMNETCKHTLLWTSQGN